jgi:Chaperone of endosialidase
MKMKKILLGLLSLSILWPLDAMALSQSAVPTKFNIPWGNGAAVPYIRTIPQASQIGIQNCAASLTDGFPPLTFTPSNSGGCPPFGADFNGILKQITQWQQWQAAGGPILYDAGFQSAIGGYPKSSQLTNATTPGCYWISTIDANGSDPDTGGANWIKSCQSPWTVSGNNIYNNNTGDVAIGTTTPATLFDIEGPNAVFSNHQNGGFPPTVFQLADSSISSPQTSESPTISVSRFEHLTSTAGANSVFYAEMNANNVSTDTVGLFGVSFQSGTGDSTGVIGHGKTLSTYPNKMHGFGGFFEGESAPGNSNNSAIGVQADVENFSGGNHSLANYLSTSVGDFGIQLTSDGTNNTTAGVFIANIATTWDVDIYIANTPSTYQMLGSGFNIDTSGNFNHTSDKTMKNTIKNISDGALDKVMKLVPSTFVLNEDPKQRVYAGLLAQDIQPVMPEAITTDIKGHLVENDSSVIAYLVKAIQELKQQNDVLAAKITALSK